MSLQNLSPAVARSLAVWHEMVATKDLAPFSSILHPDASFRSPMAINPYHSAAAVQLVISTVITIFADFRYHREFATDDGSSVVLEFSANVGALRVKGIDCIQFDAEGRIIDFEVMIRPLNGLQALGAEMGQRLGHLLPDFKGRG